MNGIFLFNSPLFSPSKSSHNVYIMSVRCPPFLSFYFTDMTLLISQCCDNIHAGPCNWNGKQSLRETGMNNKMIVDDTYSRGSAAFEAASFGMSTGCQPRGRNATTTSRSRRTPTTRNSAPWIPSSWPSWRRLRAAERSWCYRWIVWVIRVPSIYWAFPCATNTNISLNDVTLKCSSGVSRKDFNRIIYYS